jgi:sigma54-dependent transcription regulator
LHFLYNYPENEVAPFLSWLKKQIKTKVTSQFSKLKSPIDFHDIYLSCNQLLTDLMAESDEPIAILLSPGTPAMQAVWILLDKTKYKVIFYQSSIEQGVQQVNIPFKIAAEYLPQQLPKPEYLAQLAAGDVSVNAAFNDIITQDPYMLDLKSRATVLAKRSLQQLSIMPVKERINLLLQ